VISSIRLDSRVLCSGVNLASETREKPSGKGDRVDATEQSVYAVLSIDHFMLLRTENDYSISILQQMESAVSLMSQQVRTGAKGKF